MALASKSSVELFVSFSILRPSGVGGKYFPADTFVVSVFVACDFPAVGESRVEGCVNDIPSILCFVAYVDGSMIHELGTLYRSIVIGLIKI